jgi:hypothetical protein
MTTNEHNQKNQNVALAPLFFIVLFNICRQFKVSLQVFIGLSILFFIVCILCFWQGTIKLTLEKLLGKSSFDFRSKNSWLTMLGFITLTVVTSGPLRFYGGTSPLRINSLEPIYVLSPLIEEALGRCIIMNALRESVSDFWVVILTIPVWLSFHDLTTFNIAALILSELISCTCYLRFSSLGCCYVLHFLWDFIVEY